MQKRGAKIKFKPSPTEDPWFRAKKSEKASGKLQIVFKPKTENPNP